MTTHCIWRRQLLDNGCSD